MGSIRVPVVVVAALAAAAAMVLADTSMLCLGAALAVTVATVAFAGGRWMLKPDLALLAVMVATVHRWEYPDRPTTDTITAVLMVLVVVTILSSGQRQSLTAIGLALASATVLASTIGDPELLRWAGVAACAVVCASVAFRGVELSGAGVVAALVADITALVLALAMVATMAIVGDLSRVVLIPIAVMVLTALGVVARWGSYSQLLAAERSRSAVRAASVPMAEMTADGRLLQVSTSCDELGFASGTNLLEAIQGSSHESVMEAVELSRAGTGPSVCSIRRLAEDEGWRDIEVDLRYLGPVTDTWVASFTDRTDDLLDRQRQAVELGRLRDAVTTDQLTGVLNREGIITSLQARLRTSAAVAVFLDLDGFKAVNDTYGHEAGDAVLIAVARRLHGAVADGWAVGRLGGDEFLLVGGDAELKSEDLAHLADLIARPVAHAERHLNVETSIGVAVGQPGADPDALLRAADAEMYRHKQQRRGGETQLPTAAGELPVVGERRLSQLFTR